MGMFTRKKTGKNAQASPIGPQTDLTSGFALDPNSPYTTRPEHPWAIMPIYRRNVGLQCWNAFHYGEESLPGRVYGTYQPMYRRASSIVIGAVPGSEVR
jgi:hypothetical protein